MQQATPQELLTSGSQLVVHMESDTAHPQTVVPIFYIHDGDVPFCNNLRCFCQAGKRAGAILYQDVAAGKLRLAQYNAGGQTTVIDQPTVHRVYVPLVEGVPEECQLYGHTWQRTTVLGLKVCALCRLWGYCPTCTPIAPPNAQPFYCTFHTPKDEV